MAKTEPATAEQLILAAAYIRENCPDVRIVEVVIEPGQLLPLTAFLAHLALVPGPMPTETPNWLDINGVRFVEAAPKPLRKGRSQRTGIR